MSQPTIQELLIENSGKLPPYAWPGGYPICYLDSEGSILCPHCATIEALDCDAIPQFAPVSFVVLESGEVECCENCNAKIE